MGHNVDDDRAHDGDDQNSDADSIEYSAGSYLLNDDDQDSLSEDEDAFDNETQQPSDVSGSGHYSSDVSEEAVDDASKTSGEGVDDVHDSFEADTREDAVYDTEGSSAEGPNDEEEDRVAPSGGVSHQPVTNLGDSGGSSSGMQDSNDEAAVFGHQSQGSDDVFGDSFGGGLDDFNTSF